MEKSDEMELIKEIPDFPFGLKSNITCLGYLKCRAELGAMSFD